MCLTGILFSMNDPLLRLSDALCKGDSETLDGEIFECGQFLSALVKQAHQEENFSDQLVIAQTQALAKMDIWMKIQSFTSSTRKKLL